MTEERNWDVRPWWKEEYPENKIKELVSRKLRRRERRSRRTKQRYLLLEKNEEFR